MSHITNDRKTKFVLGYRTGTGHRGTCSLCAEPITVDQKYHLETGDRFVDGKIIKATFKHWECSLTKPKAVAHD